MTRQERQAMIALATIFALRMFGLFLILPVLTLFTYEISQATPALIGLAVGVYGLTQAVFQIPFGRWSDKYGRRPLITLGLLLFLSGSLLGVLSENIYSLIAARALQGAGAIAAVVMATAGDLIRGPHQSKAMASIGMSIGLSFMLALVSGPLLVGWLGISGLFGLMALLGLVAMAVLWLAVPFEPQPPQVVPSLPIGPALKQVLARSDLLRLDLGVFILHFCLTALFIVLPLMLKDQLHLETDKHGGLYATALILSVFLMLPTLILTEKKRQLKLALLIAISSMWLAQILWWQLSVFTWSHMLALLVLFFFGFNLLEALLPSLISRQVGSANKGLALGIFSTAQFLGAFSGGTLGGILFARFGVTGVFLSCLLLLTGWLVLTWGMHAPMLVAQPVPPTEGVG